MVTIRMPPPIGSINPQWLTLKDATLIRIFDPTRRKATATDFRNYGPIHRFDHHRPYPNNLDPERSVMYLGQTLSCCLVEVFGSGGVVKIEQQQVAYLTLTQSLKLLDLRDSGAMGAGTVFGISSVPGRNISQAWGKYFYDESQLYGEVDGLIFAGAHNGEDALMLYERAKPAIATAKVEVLPLNHSELQRIIYETARTHGLLVR